MSGLRPPSVRTDRRRRSLAAVAASALIVTLLAPPPALGDEPIVECNVPVRMSDGVDLRANVTRPGSGTYPTILTVTGYNKDLGQPAGSCSAGDGALVAAGYNVVVVDDRGTGSSGGRWGRWDERTQTDYAEVVDWIVAQPWSEAAVGTTGGSYLGITALLVAATGHPAVKAVFADVPMADAFRDGTTFFGGNFNTLFFPLWLGLTQGMNANLPSHAFQGDPPADVARDAYDHWTGGPAVVGAEVVRAGLLGDPDSPQAPYDSEVYRMRSPAEHAGDITAAVFYTGGWFDIFQRSTPYLWNALSNTPEGGKKWVQSPIYHVGGSSHWNEMGIGPKAAVRTAWFDRWLRDEDNGVEDIPDIHLWKVGAEEWQTASTWPPEGTSWTSLYLDPEPSGSAGTAAGDGSLTLDVPDEAAFDLLPFTPVGGLCNRSTVQWSFGFPSLAGTPCETDQRADETTRLTYSTSPLEEPLHVAGPINLSLWATLDRPDASFYVALTDVAPDGTSTQISAGALNASHRAIDPARTWFNEDGDVVLPWHPFTAEALEDVPLNQPQEYHIEIFPTNWVLQPGHRLRLVVGTANTPHFTVPQDRLRAMLGGTIRVLSGPGYPSRLILPVQPDG